MPKVNIIKINDCSILIEVRQKNGRSFTYRFLKSQKYKPENARPIGLDLDVYSVPKSVNVEAVRALYKIRKSLSAIRVFNTYTPIHNRGDKTWFKEDIIFRPLRFKKYEDISALVRYANVFTKVIDL